MSTHASVTGTTGGIHIPFNWTFASATLRNAATNPNTGAAYASADLGKLCWQTDTNGVFVLLTTGPSWIPVYQGILTDTGTQTFVGPVSAPHLIINGAGPESIAAGTAALFLSGGNLYVKFDSGSQVLLANHP